jgi:nanoRNase/pAp phosphatase (c-di-AMP/oligoRNAs hydrolase)
MDAQLFMSPNPVSQEQMQHLRQAAGPGPVLILTHDNPDPDGLASGKALAWLLQSSWGIATRLVYSGMVARVENKAMLKHLTPEWVHSDTLPGLEEYPAVALVDTQPGAGNNRLPEQVVPSIVIDHHRPVRGGLSKVAYSDVRTEVGATVSLVYQYLEAAGLTPDADLATAIFYGVQADTQGLSRGGSAADQYVYFRMLSRLDRSKLALVEQAGLPREYFQAFNRGLQAAQVFGRVVVCKLGALHRPDFVAEMADLLIRLDDTRAVLCLGWHSSQDNGDPGIMYLSLRTAAGEKDASLLVQQVIFPPGKAGGHGSAAGGQVPLAALSAEAVAVKLQERFIQAMGETPVGQPLL